MRIKTSYRFICRTLLFGPVIFCILFPASNAHSQILSNAFSGANSAFNGFVSQDLPGAFDAAMPLLFPPYFGGEIRIRPTSMDLMKGEVKLNTGIINAAEKWYDLETGKLPDGDPNGVPVMGLSSKGSYLETMVRLQFS